MKNIFQFLIIKIILIILLIFISNLSESFNKNSQSFFQKKNIRFITSNFIELKTFFPIQNDFKDLKFYIFNENLIFIDSKKKKIISFKKKDGKFNWKIKINNCIQKINTIVENQILLQTEEGNISSYSLKNGKFLWKSKKINPSILSKIISKNNQIYFQLSDNQIFSLSLKNGKSIWYYNNEIKNNINFINQKISPLIYNNSIIFALNNGKIISLNNFSGNLIWENFDNIYEILDFQLENNKIYFLNSKGEIFSLNSKNGSLIWKQKIFFEIHNLNLKTKSEILILSNSLNNLILALNKKNGSIIWIQNNLLKNLYFKTFFFKKMILLGNKNGFFYWILLKNGKIFSFIKIKKKVFEIKKYKNNIIYIFH